MKANAYSSGTILWIDDEIEVNAFERTDGADVAWQNTFGGLDNRVFRLMNLSLDIARTRRDAISAITDLTSFDKRGNFVQAVVDLRLPDTDGENQIPEMKHGIDIAKRLQELQVPFYVLSNAAQATRELDRAHVDRMRYFSKDVAKRSGSVMPEDLGRLILSEFRKSITWLDLTATFARFDSSSSHPLTGQERWGVYFPFFASYRDFVERWELRSGRSSLHRVILRAPADHSDRFVMQCVAVILSGVTVVDAPRVVYVTSNNPSSYHSLRGTDALDSTSLHLIVRFTGSNMESEIRLLEEVLRDCKRTQLTVIVPQDERAEELLRILSTQSDATYDDLPQTRFKDRHEREQLIRFSARVVFQSLRFPMAGNTIAPLHELFLRFPEILIDPAHWAFLREADHVAEEISDPFEVLACFGRIAAELSSWHADAIAKLVGGQPIPRRLLLRPADNIFAQQPEHHKKWVVRAFEDWLVSSWQTPYSVLKKSSEVVQESDIPSWETHCFDIALDLARQLQELEDTNGLNIAVALHQAAHFLRHSTITRMLASEVKPSDWAELETERWPHQQFPMPAALHRQLKAEGRYLWVQSDLLDRAGVVISGREAMQRVEARAERHARRIDWLARAIPVLPEGWKQSAQDMLDLISSRSIELAWSDDHKRAQAWQSLYALVHNATPVSLIFYSLFENPDAGVSDTLLADLNVKGAGALLGKIRGKRATFATKALKFVEPQHGNWQQNLDQVGEYARFIRLFFDFDGHNKAKQHLSESLDTLTARLSELERPIETAAGGHQVQALLDMLFDPLVGLQVGILNEKFPKKGATIEGILRYGTMRGMAFDFLLSTVDAAEKLRAAILPIAYFDGYHLLSIIQDLRNLEKTHAPKDIEPRILHKLMELFLLGFEGLVAQLKWCMHAADRGDLAQNIPLATLQVAPPTKCPIDGLDAVLRVRGTAGHYEVFTLGLPGASSVTTHTYDLPGRRLVYERAAATAAAQ